MAEKIRNYSAMPKNRIRLNVDATPEFNAKLERLADELGCSKAMVLRIGFSLLDVSHQARKAGYRVGVANPGQVLRTEFIVGLG